MCGIAASICLKKELSNKRTSKMLKGLFHRGPDAFGIKDFNHISLGNTRLAIQDLSNKGEQPLTDDENRWTLVFNGEIFNHLNLRKQLKNNNWKSTSDTETLLYGLIEKGVQFLNEIDGFFALIGYQHSTEKVLIARDKLGVKPLYIGTQKNEFWISSEIKPIVDSDFITEPESNVLISTLIDRWHIGHKTGIKGIERMEPGTYRWIDLKTLKQDSNYWFRIEDLINLERYNQIKGLDDEPLQEELESILRESVRSRLLSDAQVGLICSGGLDSSLIAALATEVTSRPLTAYSAVFPDQPDVDEYPFAKLICSQLKIPYVPISINTENWKSQFVLSTINFGYPLVHESSVALAVMTKEIKSHGVKVLISGDGADELFGGYASRHIDERKAYDPNWSKVNEISIRSSDKWIDLLQKPNIREADYSSKIYNSIFDKFSFLDNSSQRLNTCLVSDLRFFLCHGLKRLDKNLMQYSVEGREPFLSNALLDFSINLPLERKVRPELKGILKKIALKYIPSEIVKRRKVGFSYSCSNYLEDAQLDFLKFGVLRDMLEVSKQDWSKLCELLDERSKMRFFSAEIWGRSMVLKNSNDEITNALWTCL